MIDRERLSGAVPDLGTDQQTGGGHGVAAFSLAETFNEKNSYNFVLFSAGPAFRYVRDDW
jgi:hypothetical protein